MEIMSKGPGEKGAVWVATRVTDGMVSGHANQARTTTFVQNDADRVQFAPDVVTYNYFDIILDRYPARAVWCALLGAHAYRVLIGACDPMVCPVHPL